MKKNKFETKYKVGDKVVLINNVVVTIDFIDSDDVITKSSNLNIRGLYHSNYRIITPDDSIFWISVNDIKGINISVLTEEEKNYLTNIIKPLKKDSNISDFFIAKHKSLPYSSEYIDISIYSANGDFITSINFPSFKEGKYYKGLELYKEYNVKDLGI